jgi:hypothetical protein
MVQCSILAVLCAKSSEVNKILPLNLYGHDLFSENQRGKILKKDMDPNKSSSSHYGLIKSFMPLAKNDEAMSDTPFIYLKASEQATYNPSAEWPTLSFSWLMHPFSNSISGTVLCQLRILAKFKKDQANHPAFFIKDEKTFKDFMRSFSSTLLFFSGGHSFLEFLFPLRLNTVIDQFSDSKKGDYLNLSGASLFDMFHSSNNNDIRIAVAESLKKTISYNQIILQKKSLNEEIVAFDKTSLTHVDPTIPIKETKKRKREDDSEFEPIKAPKTVENSSPHYTATDNMDIPVEEDTNTIESKKRKRELEITPSEKRSKINNDFRSKRKSSASENDTNENNEKNSSDDKKNRPV